MSTPTLHIAIDGNEANVTQRVGSNVYAFEMLTALEKVAAREKAVVTVLLTAPPVADLPSVRSGWSYKVVGPRPFWTQFALPIHLWRFHHLYDVFYTPGHYAPRWSSVPVISSVMDLAFLEYPKFFKRKDYVQLKEWTRQAAHTSVKLIAISEFTKSQIVKYYRRRPEDIVVAPPALPKAIAQSSDDSQAKNWAEFQRLHGIRREFFLHIGTLQPRKNLERAIEAFEMLNRERQKNGQPLVQLVVAGRVGWLANSILLKIEQSPFYAEILRLGFLSDREKNWLLAHTSAVLQVGLLEGFGIPALEALHQNVLVIAANNSSIPEVVGKSGFLVSPTNINDIYKSMKKVLSLTARERAQRLKYTRLQRQLFSWTKSAETIFATLVATLHAAPESDS